MLQRCLAGVAALGLAFLTTACGGSQSGPSASSTTTPPTTSSTVANRLNTPEAGRKLCDSMRASLENWRVQTPTPDKIDFNFMVQQWAAMNGGFGAGNLSVVQNKGVVDTVTQAVCPDVRQQTIEAFEVKDLASALVGS